MVEPLVLASTSKWRAAMLKRLGLSFTQLAPDFDELSVTGVTPEQAALACALGKARAAAGGLETGWVIGSDQVADLEGHRLHKPANVSEAAERLSQLSGKWHALHTAVVLVSARDGTEHTSMTTVRLKVKELTADQISHYIKIDNPIGCAGAYMIEGLGIALFEEIQGCDESAIVGLPLMALCGLLRRVGIEPLSDLPAALTGHG
jgi:septum formation protein